jgi:hypothetical protein
MTSSQTGKLLCISIGMGWHFACMHPLEAAASLNKVSRRCSSVRQLFSGTSLSMHRSYLYAAHGSGSDLDYYEF